MKDALVAPISRVKGGSSTANTSGESRTPKVGSKSFLLCQDLFPHVVIEGTLITLFLKKIGGQRTSLLASFNCAKKLKRSEIFAKAAYLFDEFYMLSETEIPNFQDEYSLVSYSDSEKQCMHIINAFVKDLNTEVPKLNAENYPAARETELTENLTPFDFMFLQNFRMLMERVEKREEFELTLVFPAFNFVHELVPFPAKMPSSPLAKRLTSKGAEGDIGAPTFGFFTMDSYSRLVPLEYGDPEVQKVGLFGFWTYGLEVTEDTLRDSKSVKQMIWGLHAYFLKNTRLGPKEHYYPNNGHVYAAFSHGSRPKAFLARLVDRDAGQEVIQKRRFKVPFETDVDLNVDFSMHEPVSQPQDPRRSLVQTDTIFSSTLSKNFDRAKTNGLPNQSMRSSAALDLSEIGIQTEMRESLDEERALVKYIQRNENFYRQTIDKMQEQINLLSQAVLSINQTLNLINLKQSMPTQPLYPPPPQREIRRCIDDVPNPLYDSTSKSISISESSNHLILGPETAEVSKMMASEARRSPRHKRYRTGEMQIITAHKELQTDRNKSLEIDASIPIFRHNDSVQSSNADILIDSPKTSKIKDPVLTETLPEPKVQQPPTQPVQQETPVAKESILERLQAVNRQNEHSFSNQVNNSIPLPEISKRFQNYKRKSLDSDDSDGEGATDFKSIQKKYVAGSFNERS